MKKKFNMKWVATLIVCFTAISCDSGKEDEDPTPDPEQIDDPVQSNSCKVVQVTNSITSNTEWKEGNVYVIEADITISGTLTIHPGVIVKIRKDKSIIVDHGKLLANGTAEKRITFTSMSDDRYCGDTNNNGTASSPQKGDWGAIYLQSAGSVLKYCDILYAGGSDWHYSSALRLDVGGAKTTIDHCTIAHTQHNDHYSTAAFWGWEWTKTGETVFTNNVMYDNDRPMLVHQNYTVDESNIFHNPAKPSETNKRNGIFLLSMGGFQGTVTLGITEVPYVIRDWVQVNSSAKRLIVKDKVIVKFDGGSGQLSISNGAQFESSPGAIYTSIKDDTRGGDTNGDGNATSPAKGDWQGICLPGQFGCNWFQTNVYYSKN